MKYEITFKNKDRGIEVEVPQIISPVAILLMGDIQSKSQPWLDVIHKVLSGESNYEECTGNNCSLEINKDTTLIIDHFSDEDEECVIETKELEQIIKLWTKKISNL